VFPPDAVVGVVRDASDRGARVHEARPREGGRRVTPEVFVERRGGADLEVVVATGYLRELPRDLGVRFECEEVSGLIVPASGEEHVGAGFQGVVVPVRVGHGSSPWSDDRIDAQTSGFKTESRRRGWRDEERRPRRAMSQKGS
jgi:hypothetical protein